MPPSTVDEYERRAEEAEASTLPTFLKIGRGVVWAIYAIALVVVVLLVTAFLLRLFGASTDAAFTQWVYRNADSAMRPFRGIFPTQELNDNSVFDPSLLFGAICYTVAALLADAVLHWLTARLRREQAAVTKARADADAVRLQYEQQEARNRQAAYELAAQQEATRRAAATAPVQTVQYVQPIQAIPVQPVQPIVVQQVQPPAQPASPAAQPVPPVQPAPTPEAPPTAPPPAGGTPT